jgi:hypothetical protein
VPAAANGRPRPLASRADQSKGAGALIGDEIADDDMLTRRRAAASLALLPTDRLADETAAFDVLISMDYAGHWVETSAGRAAVTWVGDGECIETELCEGDAEKVIAAIRPTIPASHLRSAKDSTEPQYDVAAVEALLLVEVAAELHPEHLSTGGLLRRIATDPDDAKEIETGIQAIRNLREFGLFTQRDDEIVKPTPAAIRAVALFT